MNNILRKFTSKGKLETRTRGTRTVVLGRKADGGWRISFEKVDQDRPASPEQSCHIHETFWRNNFSEISAKEYLKQVFHHEKIIFADLMVEFKNIERDLNERMAMADRNCYIYLLAHLSTRDPRTRTVRCYYRARISWNQKILKNRSAPEPIKTEKYRTNAAVPIGKVPVCRYLEDSSIDI